VRIAIPDYIGVREPIYTTAIGLIKFAYKNARIQGRMLDSHVGVSEPKEKKVQKQPQPKATKSEKQPEEKISSRVKKFFGYFFE
jgi:cell division protein FtsA